MLNTVGAITRRQRTSHGPTQNQSGCSLPNTLNYLYIFENRRTSALPWAQGLSLEIIASVLAQAVGRKLHNISFYGQCPPKIPFALQHKGARLNFAKVPEKKPDWPWEHLLQSNGNIFDIFLWWNPAGYTWTCPRLPQWMHSHKSKEWRWK